MLPKGAALGTLCFVTCSIFDVFKIGIGPSSSHTVGPMIAARWFAVGLAEAGLLDRVDRLCVELFGSLGATGWGHGTGSAVLIGLEGEQPATVDTETLAARVQAIRQSTQLRLLSADGGPGKLIRFDPTIDLIRHMSTRLPFHPNAMQFTAWAGEEQVADEIWYSIGGGQVLKDDGTGSPPLPVDERQWPFPFRRGAHLIDLCNDNQLTIPQLMMANEVSQRPEAEVRERIAELWRVITECIETGQRQTGTLPGGLFVARRAPQLYRRLQASGGHTLGVDDPLAALDWVSLWALAVNEQNAAGGRVVTAPTNGAAGIIPAVGSYAVRYLPGGPDEQITDFLLTAAAIGIIFKATASISGAEVGCQGEVGTACAMAAAGLAQLLGGTPQQVVNAAEIGLEHHLGLTCDPVGGLVQIPCIERNAVAAVKAITAARLAINDDGYQYVTLDNCVRTMMETGLDMNSKYKETAAGGLAVNIVEC